GADAASTSSNAASPTRCHRNGSVSRSSVAKDETSMSGAGTLEMMRPGVAVRQSKPMEPNVGRRSAPGEVAASSLPERVLSPVTAVTANDVTWLRGVAEVTGATVLAEANTIGIVRAV